MRILGYFILLVQFFGQKQPNNCTNEIKIVQNLHKADIWLMRILAMQLFPQNQKLHQARTPCNSFTSWKRKKVSLGQSAKYLDSKTFFVLPSAKKHNHFDKGFFAYHQDAKWLGQVRLSLAAQRGWVSLALASTTEPLAMLPLLHVRDVNRCHGHQFSEFITILICLNKLLKKITINSIQQLSFMKKI